MAEESEEIISEYSDAQALEDGFLAEVDHIKSLPAPSGQPVNLDGLTQQITALSAHLGIGTA